MVYKLSVKDTFASAHFLREYKGKCENLHGHNWRIKISFCGNELQSNGMLIDFTDIKSNLKKIISYLDHKCLNETEPFNKINPTAENIAVFIFKELKKTETKLAKICEVEVCESENSSALYSE
jgi:6-pyruvoyltetrahydropterin/6-carboxytetrahydropterin synthase